MNVQHVPIEWVNHAWPKAAPFIERAFAESSGDFTVDYAQAMVLTGQWVLLVVVEDGVVHGAITVSFFNRPGDRVAFITAIGGRLVSNKETFAQLKAIVAKFGATTLEGAARESVARLWSRYGFKEKSRIVGVKL